MAVTFNTGGGAGGSGDSAGGFGAEQARISDEYYGNGLAWSAVVEDVRRFLAAVQPDVVAFQEIFHSSGCETIPVEARAGFVCEHWRPGDPTVAQVILGAGYQIACHLEKPDKCAAVRRSFGRFRGCEGELCLDGLQGQRVADCGGGSRIGRGTLELAGGGELELVSVHGSSGITDSDRVCRVRQFEQIFVDLGDGLPAARGARNLILGDFNTDPGRLAELDPSARRLLDFAGEGRRFRFHTPPDPDVPTYAGLVDIDHVLSDSFSGSCRAYPSEGEPPVTSVPYFDHRPIVCTLIEAAP